MADRIRDIRLIDSYLIGGGAGLIMMSFLGFAWFDPTRGLVMPGLLVGVVSMIVGWRVRVSERTSIELWRMLDAARELSLSDIQLTTGWPRRRILKNLALVNTVAGVEYVHLEEEGLIVDHRLLDRVAVREECDGCGYTITEEVPLLLSEAPECPSCGSGMTTDLNEKKGELLDEMKRETVAYRDPSHFNGCLFLLLWIIPPAAIGYGLFSLTRHLDRKD